MICIRYEFQEIYPSILLVYICTIKVNSIYFSRNDPNMYGFVKILLNACPSTETWFVHNIDGRLRHFRRVPL